MSALGLAEFHFLRPLWLLALLLLPLLPWLLRRRRAAAEPWRRLIDAPLLEAQTAAVARAGRLQEVLLLTGTLIAVLALAGPAFRTEPQPLLKLQAPLLLALDLSASVRAADLKPDRLSRARLKLAELIRLRRDGQTALIAFAGEAFTVAPLTDDASTLDSLLAALDPSILPVPGQRPERAIRMAGRLFADSGARQGRLLLLTDRAGAAAVDAAREAAAAGLSVSVLGLGTPEGAPVAVGGGGFMRDEAGNIRLPRLDEPGLRALAEAGQGVYARFSADGSDLRALGLDAGPEQGEALRVDEAGDTGRYRDEGPLLALLLLPLAALAARRGWLLVLPLALLPALHTSPAVARTPSAAAANADAPGAVSPIAQFWNDLWSRRERQAWDALQKGQPERAQELAPTPALRGSAAYRAGDYQTALEQFELGDDARSHYNRGNALAKLERYEEALAAYDAALAREPQHADAAANRAAVQDWLQQQSQSQDGQRGEKGEKGEQGEPGEQGERGEDNTGERGEEGQDAASEDTGQPEQEPTADPTGEGGEGDESQQPPAAEAGDESEDSQQAYSEAMQEALEAQQDEAQPDEAAPVDAEAMAEAERQQALEQLLRRVPDDPGGLLRRKFLLEYQRRQREGDL
jgi:Ca-activated chloride channel family protein